VRSILGRFLEHSRVYYFHNNGDEELLIGSADMMHRNLDRRVEALVRVQSPELKERLKKVLDLAFSDTRSAWTLDGNGDCIRPTLRPARQASRSRRADALCHSEPASLN
jgi:polyphosphate kinase